MPLELELIAPARAISRVYLHQLENEADLENLRVRLSRLIDLLEQTADTESEEHTKSNFAAFLREVWYADFFYINTSNRIDLAIANGPNPEDPLAVLIEAKRPNSPDFPAPDRYNVKALHQLLFYYMNERKAGNNQIKHLIATNGWEWYIMDELWWDTNVWQNQSLRADFLNFNPKKSTETFYRDIAKPFFDQVKQPMPAVYLTFKNYQTESVPVVEEGEGEEKNDFDLINLFKILSPWHLLKLNLANDSNSLNQAFYFELLHILGLEENTTEGITTINRVKLGRRQAGSLIELAIAKLPNHQDNLLSEAAKEEFEFETGLSLVITWINRLLFLKLLEGNLLKMNGKKAEYRFLSLQHIPSFDWLNALFFEVLAVKPEERIKTWSQKFPNVPWLNSSLFERTDTEQEYFEITALTNHEKLALFPNTILRTEWGKTREGDIETIPYLLSFLNAYDFGSDPEKSSNRLKGNTLINASVLGLIFEKINGYKEGSVFTPGYITMYMCQESIRQVIVDKFNEELGWNAPSFPELSNYITDRSADKLLQYNRIVNSITICDPSVGSGHFLVSALNEILACKFELKIFADENGLRPGTWEAKIENDELMVYDSFSAKPFEYIRLKNGTFANESQKLLQTLFHEKKQIIENCLFGVDINANSARICRLRLWIELLKSAYYTPESRFTELQTLPNIDINIKIGNSLVSKLNTDDNQNRFTAAKRQQIKNSLPELKTWTELYYHANTVQARAVLNQKIVSLRKWFNELYNVNEPDYLAWQNKAKQLGNMGIKAFKEQGLADNLLAETQELEKRWKAKNAIFKNAFEWRFEFPKVLDEKGKFVGFDIVTGNPPYIRQEEITHLKQYLEKHYQVYASTADILVYFYELAFTIAKPGGTVHFITSNKFVKSAYGKALRNFLAEREIVRIIDFGELRVFNAAATFPAIFWLRKKKAGRRRIFFSQITNLKFEHLFPVVKKNQILLPTESINPEEWILSGTSVLNLVKKLRAVNGTLGDGFADKMHYGTKTGLNAAFIIDEETKNKLMKLNPENEDIIKPVIIGDQVRKYKSIKPNQYLIVANRRIEIEKYPSVMDYLSSFREALSERAGTAKWYELQTSPTKEYQDRISQPKIIYPDIAKESRFTIDYSGAYLANTVYFLACADLWLLGILNSKIVFWYMKKVATVLGDPDKAGRLRFFTQTVKTIPLPILTENDKAQLSGLVAQILKLKADNQEADTSRAEEEIDRMLFGLYALNEEEIEMIDNLG